MMLSDLANSSSVSKDELDYVFKIVDTNGDQVIRSCGMNTLLNCWGNYQGSLEEIEDCFRKYDPNGTGRLDRHQLQRLLSEIGEASGHYRVTDAEVDWVLSQADILKNGVITKPELRRALALFKASMTSMKKEREKSCCAVQ